MRRALKRLVLTAGGLFLILLLSFGTWIIAERIAYERVNITDALLRDGRYDPAAHFVFDRACTISPEGWPYSLFKGRDYRSVNLIYLPDTYTHWTLVLIDDKQETYRTLYAIDPIVKSPGDICNSRITLRTETVDGQITAYVEEERMQSR